MMGGMETRKEYRYALIVEPEEFFERLKKTYGPNYIFIREFEARYGQANFMFKGSPAISHEHKTTLDDLVVLDTILRSLHRADSYFVEFEVAHEKTTTWKQLPLYVKKDLIAYLSGRITKDKQGVWLLPLQYSELVDSVLDDSVIDQMGIKWNKELNKLNY